MNGFERRKQKKIEDILNSSKELFCRKGVKSVSVTEIAKKAQVSPVSIYNFFGSKDNLAKEVVFSIMNTEMKDYEELIESNISFEDKLNKIISMKFNTIDKYNTLVSQSNIWQDPIIKDFMTKFYEEKTIPLMKKLIVQGKKEGCIDPNISTESILLYLKMFKSLLDNPVIYTDKHPDLIKLFFFGILGNNKI